MKRLHIIPAVLMIASLASCDSNSSCASALFPMDIEYIKNKEYDIYNVGVKVFLGLFPGEINDRRELNAMLIANENDTLDIGYYTESTVLKTYNDDDLRDMKFVYDTYTDKKDKTTYYFRGNEYIKIPKSTFKNEEGIITITFYFMVDKNGVLTPSSGQGQGFWYEKRPNSKIRFREVKDSDIKRNYIFGRLK